MEINQFIKVFSEQFDETPLELFQPGTTFKDLEEWNSLTALSVIAMIDEEYEKRMTGADLRGCTTIEDLFTLVKSK
jgi:acyl carrier protein